MEEQVEVSKIIAELDREIVRLKEARALLAGEPSSRKSSSRTSTKRTGRMSAEGRRRIAEAMKKRWAERRKQQATKGK
jgi:hypothetical protein